jgi:hypothetical protein
MEAAMIGTILVILAALVIAIFGCAWLRPDVVSQVDEDGGEHRI